MSCNHERLLKISAKASDTFYVEAPHLDIEKEGYMPRIPGLGGGDYINLTICLDCREVISMPSSPISDDEIIEAL